MPAVYKRPDSKIYWTAWRDEAGKLYRKSTKCTNRSQAEKAAAAMTAAFRKRKVSAHVREVCLNFHREATGEAMPETSLRAYADTWLATKKNEVSTATYSFYDSVKKRLVAHLGTKAEADINFLTKADMVGFRDALAAKLSATSARHVFKGARMIFRAARMDGILSFDPMETVKPTKKADTARRTRRPFTVEEIHRILSACDDEWRGLVIFALHTGQRLGDLARLTRANVDETHGTLNLTTRKTRARIAIPLSADLRAVLKTNPAPKGARPEAVPLFPKAWRIVKESGKVSTLSLQFTNILAAVNLREAVTHTSAKKGRDTAREVATVSFHSLRHSAVSLLKAAGVPDATVMALVGHETLAMSSHYTHVGKESLESAVASLPSFVPVPPSQQ
jgi:integrase